MSEKITVAQALRKIKRLKGLLAEHTQRAIVSSTYVSTKVPAFSFKSSVEARKIVQSQLIDLEARVAKANATAIVKNGDEFLSLSAAIRSLQEMKGDIAFLKGLVLRSETVKERSEEWSDEHSKFLVRYTEVQYISDLSEQDRDSQIKDLQNKFETLNNVVENANHQIFV